MDSTGNVLPLKKNMRKHPVYFNLPLGKPVADPFYMDQQRYLLPQELNSALAKQIPSSRRYHNMFKFETNLEEILQALDAVDRSRQRQH